MSDTGRPSLDTTMADDRVMPFQVDALDVRGRVVRLGDAVDTVLRRHAYPPLVSKVLGEAMALVVILGSSLKFEGRFQIQTRSDGPVDMLVVDFEAPDKLRGYARFDAERLSQAIAAGTTETATLLGHGTLAMTIEPGGDMSRYQGVVALDGTSLEEAAHTYFRQSEQIPTRVRLAVAEAWTGSNGTTEKTWRAGGVLVQFLPEAGERARTPDLDPGDAPEGDVQPEPVAEDDAWVEAQSIVATIEDHELIDPTLESERLLYRLFHERGVRVFPAVAVREACHCSRERVSALLKNFTGRERRDMVADDGAVTVTCEFCSTVYRFAPHEIDIPNND